MKSLIIKLWSGIILGVGVSAMAVASDLPDGSIQKLGSDQFEERQAAYAELKKWTKENIRTSPESLREVWSQSSDPEVKTRCYTLMKEALISRQFGRGKGFVGIMMDLAVIGGQAQGKARACISIVQVVPDTPAQKAGLLVGDRICGVDAVDFNKLPVKDQRVDIRSIFQTYVKSKHPDDVITLHLERAGKKMDQEVTLMRRPASADLGHERKEAQKEGKLFFEQWLKSPAQ